MEIKSRRNKIDITRRRVLEGGLPCEGNIGGIGRITGTIIILSGSISPPHIFFRPALWLGNVFVHFCRTCVQFFTQLWHLAQGICKGSLHVFRASQIFKTFKTIEFERRIFYANFIIMMITKIAASRVRQPSKKIRF